ncbi:hypothetical protein PSENEW3n2_00000864 [Picochlorum sp. SENEW3]|nr:hypothetical protein PSENEW3n2_00000864 [Picochlorum sp. SENEW3]WPT15786.1 hypothetical protein PSENEW3_00000864 [Picochlorum sp. SENEW3]
MLPLQFVFKGKRDKVKGSKHSQYTALHDWLFSTNPDAHWANLDTMKEWVGKVLHPYFCQKLVEKHLVEPYTGKSLRIEDIKQRCVLVLDCWKVVDLVGNYKLKALAIKEFEKYLLESLQQQIEENEKRIRQGEKPVGYTCDLKMITLREKIPEKKLILSGWKSCGLSESFSSLYQMEALERMFTAMDMDDTKWREWEAFNCAQKDLGMITPESTERWQDKVNEEEDVDRDQDEPDMVDDGGDKMPNAMKADSEDDFGLWSRSCAFATQHIYGSSSASARCMPLTEADATCTN